MKNTTRILRGALALSLIMAAVGCGDDAATGGPDAPTPDAPDTAAKFAQVAFLARPAVSEALLLSPDFLLGYAATGPTFAGVDPAVVNLIIGEAKTVLKALYLGPCLINGVLGLMPATGVKPAGIQCHAVGGAIFMADGVTLTPQSVTAAQAYADKVFDQFELDVMRVDTSGTSKYLTLCGDANTKPLLCGGRFLNDDTIDITYNYFLNGAATTKGPFIPGDVPSQVRALTSDGVAFSLIDAQNQDNVQLPDVTNRNQGHPNVSQGFPYSANPL